MHDAVVYLNAIGTAVPPYGIPQLKHSELIASANGLTRNELVMLRRIYQRSGILNRYSVLEEFGLPSSSDNKIFQPDPDAAQTTVSERMDMFDQYAPDLALEASRDCLAKCTDETRSKISHLITFSCTGMSAPGLDLQLAGLLDLNRSIERTCINFMGCYAAVNAMKTAYHIVRSQPDATVLLAGVELCTLHYRRHTSTEHLVSNALFADGAAACIISADEAIAKEGSLFAFDSFHAEFFPDGDHAMVWKIGDYGFDLYLDAYIPALVENGIGNMMQSALDKLQIGKHNIDHYAIHPGGMKILEACEKALHLSPDELEVSYDILSNYGNMSSVTILFVLNRLSQRTSAGARVFACAFGPGLTMESIILTRAVND